MFRLTTLSIRMLLLLITLVVALPAAGILFYSGLQYREMMLNDARNETLKLVESIATEQQNLVVGATQLITALAQLPEVKGHDADRVKPILTELHKLNPMYSNIFIADRQGSVWASAVSVPPPFVVADRRYFKHVMESGRLSSGEYLVSRATTRPAFNLAYPLKDDRGKVTGIISVGFLIDQYSQILARMKSPPQTSFVLLDHRGIIISRAIDPGPFLGKPYQAEEFRKMQQGPETGTAIRKGIAGDLRILSYKKIRLSGESTPYMYVVAGIPVQVAVFHANRVLMRSMAIWSSLLVLACLVAVLIGKRSILDRVRLLNDASKRLAAGDLQVRISELVRGGELGGLGSTFDQMAQQLRLRENALALSENFLNTIIETEPECLSLLDAQGNLLMMNRAGLEMIQAESFEEVKERSIYPLIAAEYREAFVRLTEEVFQGKKGSLEFEMVGLKGRRCWLDTHVVPFRNDLGEIVSLLGITRDITERKKSEEERLENLLFIESLLKYSPMGIRVFDGQSGSCVLLNQAAADIAGGKIESMRWQNFRRLDSWEASGLLQAAESVLADGVARLVDAEMQTSFRKSVVVTYMVSRLVIKDKPHLLVIGRDITDEKRLADENRQIEAQMRHVQKLESLGVLAGGIAHDFNNILLAILGNADLALLRLPPGSAARRNLQQIEKAAQRAAELAQQMLAYSGKGQFVVQTLDVNAMITEMHHILGVSISKKVEMRLELAQGLPCFEGDATQIHQIIMNLVINASEAIGEANGTITITTGVLDYDQETLSRIWLYDTLEPGSYLYLEIADTGCGMDQKTLARIFDPFFTTKFTGRGLGMAAVLGIVRGHRGAITIASEPGKGTSFRLLLPVQGNFSAAKPRESAPVKPAAGSGTVLLVDDEEMILTLGRDMLENLGYEVLTAENGAVALEIFRQRQGEIACVLLDLTMPLLDGEQTFRELRRIDAKVQVIMSSGFNEQEVTRRFDGKGLAGFIQKPYQYAQLSRMLQQVIEG